MVIRSNFRLGNKFLQHINLGINTGIFIYLENTKMYPLTKSITPATIVCNSLVYTGSNQTAQITFVTLDGDTLIEGTDYTILTNNGGTNVGTYNVTIQGTGDYVDTSTGTFNITPATGNASVSGVSLTYNGQSRNLVTVNGNTGTMHYRVGTNGTWSTSIPTATDTGSWTIYYYMDASLNYTARGSSSSPWGSVSSSIGKADQEAPTAYGATVTYGSIANAAASGGGGHGSIEWSNGDSRSAVGSQITSARWTGDSNYNGSTWSNAATLTVNKADQSAPTAQGATTTYPTAAIASASGGGGQGSIEWSNGNTRTAVGSQNTQARWSGNNNYNASDWSSAVTLIVNKASQSAPTAYGSTTTYPTAATASASGGGGAGSLVWESAQSQTSVGSHTTRCYWSGNANYNASGWSNYVTVQMNKANISPTVSMSNWTYGGTASNPSVSGNTGGGSVSYSYKVSGASDSTYTSTKPSEIGTYTVRAIISATTNYNGATVTSNFSILKMVPTLTWSRTPPTQMMEHTITKLEATSSNGEPVTYTTSNSNIAWWEMALWDGEYYNSIEVGNTSGTVTLTASVAETTYYSSASISFTMKVTW